MGYSWDDLAGAALARQFPDPVPDPAEPADSAGPAAEREPDEQVGALLAAVGPVQSQTARSPYVGLAARAPGITWAAVSAAYETGRIVRGSTIRGTVHTATPADFRILATATRVGQCPWWQRTLRLENATLEELWADTEAFAAEERSPDELTAHLHSWLVRRESAATADRVVATSGGRYLAFGHGGLVRRPANGNWAGQGPPLYRTLAPAGSGESPCLDDVVRRHLRAHGPASRHDIAWWSGLGLRVVDDVLARLPLSDAAGPDGRVYLDLTDHPGPAPRELSGVRLLPEFDALLCGYDPPARERFGRPEHLRRLQSRANGLLLAPLLVDGRITGHWRAAGTAPRRPLEVTWFAGTRRPTKAALAPAVAAVEAALDIEITDLTVTREAT